MPGIIQAQDSPVAKNVVLVHGLYADGSSWIDVIPYLQRAGLNVTVVQNPLTSLTDDVAPASAGVIKKDGFFWLNEEAFLTDFAGDVAPLRARALYAVQGRGADALPSTKTTTAAWRVKPTWYQVSTEDRTINPELERFLAKRMNATTIELDSSHVSLVSHPKEIAELILLAAGYRKAQ
jgi:pimeloyl-ACP methyl ester carboxylesterase